MQEEFELHGFFTIARRIRDLNPVFDADFRSGWRQLDLHVVMESFGTCRGNRADTEGENKNKKSYGEV